ncbi:uncharacterized protein LOC133783895 isoform X2 [Humulus lupulus]|uniref:uncharacterized protein LOC133783895 isoform X2 n=1 Tax=Humulus lupulus TaxID=3486 RepID=UPI002B40DEA6|nr:uncharacterized protein LOC133783895 isoform X2 [Humulus lupulus]
MTAGTATIITSMKDVLSCRSTLPTRCMINTLSPSLRRDQIQALFVALTVTSPSKMNFMSTLVRSVLSMCISHVLQSHCPPLHATVVRIKTLFIFLAINSQWCSSSLVVVKMYKDDFDEYYCDACEKERNLQFRVYRCDDCKYTAHVHCIIDEILKTLKGETNTNNNNNEVELRALGEFQWNWSTEMDQAKDHHHQTLGEIMYTLTQEEKKRLAHPVDLCYKLGYNRYRNLNSQFDELRSLENFDKFKEFFQSEYDDFWNEVYFYTSEEGFKVEEKYSRQEVVEVAGKYMVPKTLSPILKTLIQKYGDLDGQSSLSSGMRSVISTLLSIVIDKMCRTKIENITMDDMHEWHFYILGIEKISGFNLYGIRSILYKECMSAYLGFKAIRCEKEVPKKLDMKIATLEAELEKFKKMREELPTIMSHKSSTTLERLSKAAKWKNKTLGDAWF